MIQTAPEAAISERIACQLLHIHAALLPDGEGMHDLLAAGIPIRRVLTLYQVQYAQWPALLAAHFAKASSVKAWKATLGKGVYPWGEGERVMQVAEAKRNIFHRVTRGMDYDACRELEAISQSWDSHEALDELAAAVRQGVWGEHEALKQRFRTIMEILVLGSWWDALPEIHATQSEYRQLLAGVAVSLGLEPLPYW